MVAKLEERLIPMKEGEGPRQVQGKDGKRTTTFTFFQKIFPFFYLSIGQRLNCVWSFSGG
jgi:hypothetical protein